MRLLRCALAVLLALSCFVAHPNRSAASSGFVPRIEQETIMSSDGMRTRTLTLTDAPAIFESPAPAPGGTRAANEFVWIDRNHQNAIAENVAISGDGGYGLVGWWLNNKRVDLYNVPGGAGVPLWTHPMPASPFQIWVDADHAARRLVSTARQESLFVNAAPSADPIFSHWYPTPLVGYKAGVSDDGRTYAAAGGNPAGGAGDVQVYDGSTGLIRFKRALPAPPEGMCVSADGSCVAANVRAFVKVWDVTTGAQRDSIPIPGETQTAAVLSGDGTYLVTGGFNKTVRLYHWDGTHYIQDWANNIPGTTWVTTLAISRDGSTIAAGTWTNASGGKVVVYDRSSATPLWTDSSYGDEVASVAFTANGGMIAAGSWGMYLGTVGNVISIYNRASSTPTFTIGDDAVAGVGSCMAVDFSRNGQYLIAGGKAVHAREMGYGGFVLAMRTVAAADADAVPPALSLTAAPNPFMGTIRLNRAGAYDILSCDGRLIRTIQGTEWDGRDGTGRETAPGVYFVRDRNETMGPLRVVRIR
jgi:WD40 repeat protein